MNSSRGEWGWAWRNVSTWSCHFSRPWSPVVHSGSVILVYIIHKLSEKLMACSSCSFSSSVVISAVIPYLTTRRWGRAFSIKAHWKLCRLSEFMLAVWVCVVCEPLPAAAVCVCLQCFNWLLHVWRWISWKIMHNGLIFLPLNESSRTVRFFEMVVKKHVYE